MQINEKIQQQSQKTENQFSLVDHDRLKDRVVAHFAPSNLGAGWDDDDLTGVTVFFTDVYPIHWMDGNFDREEAIYLAIEDATAYINGKGASHAA